jgi:hypothetical protein
MKLWIENIENLPAVVWQLEAPSQNYNDYTNDIIKWDSHGLLAKTAIDQFDYKRVRDKLIPLIIAAVYPDFSNWANVSQEVRAIAAKWIIAPYALRVTVHSEEQDLIYFGEMYEKSKASRKVFVAKLANHVAVNYYRTGVITEAQAASFTLDTSSLVYEYLEFSSSSFRQWLTNAAPYENDGFAQKDYYSEGLKNELLQIYYGNL